MKMYVTVEDLRPNGEFEGLISINDRLTDKALNNLLLAGKEMIDNYCNHIFEKDVPYLVKIVNIQLINAFIADMSKKQESIDDYSYTNNQAVFNNILSQLNSLIIGKETVGGKKKNIKVRLI